MIDGGKGKKDGDGAFASPKPPLSKPIYMQDPILTPFALVIIFVGCDDRNLVEAKKFVESTPQVLKEGLNKEDAEKLKAAIEAAGGVVELE